MKGTIDIRIQNPDKTITTLPVKADIYGQWAVHYEYIGIHDGSHRFCDEAPHKLWQITQIPSGLMVRKGFTKWRDARATALSLATYPIDMTSPEVCGREELRKLFQFVSAAAAHPGVTWDEWTRAMEITA